ncbi:MAG: RNA 2',3'-cyclic phosphodiesterase [Deltaproteobacteria bacterium]|nr:RNA 2',3'-cyclic phosphodiesterase [Deltaproteobacteria bacterium]
MIRAFIAVEIDPAVIQRMIEVTDELKDRIPGIRWNAQSNCHLTLKFLGDIDEGQVEPIARALEGALSPFPRFTINAKGLGVFPDAKKPRVLWIGVEGKPLASMAEKIESALVPLGFEREKKSFTPHLTIGRWRQFKRLEMNLADTLEKYQNRNFGVSAVDKAILFQSILNPGGAVYRTLKAVRLSIESTFA